MDKNELDKVDKKEVGGIELKFIINNDIVTLDININLNNPNNKVKELFALMLYSIEHEPNTIYNQILIKLKEMVKKDNNLISLLDEIFQYKKKLDAEMATQVIWPSDVFRSGRPLQ